MSIRQTEGIVLRTYNLTDGDKVAVVFTRQHGVLRGYARGARKLKSKFGSSLEPMTIAAFTYIHKENQESVRFEKAEITQSHFNLSTTKTTLEITNYWSELLMEFLPPGMSDERIYRMVQACLNALGNGESNLRQLSCYFEIWLLKLTGFFPDVANCKNCKTKLSSGTVARINPNGILCANCAVGREPLNGAYDTLRKILTRTPADFYAETIDNSHVNILSDFVRSIVREAIEIR